MAGSWSVRRWVLALIPVVLAMGTPWIVVLVFADRLPERAYISGWSRTGPDFAYLAPSWPQWASGYLYLAIGAALVAAGLVRLRRWPPLQRLLIVMTWAVAGQIVGEAVLEVVTLLDVSGYPALPTPWWAGPASVGVGVVAAVAAWALAGRLPSAPEAVDVLPVGVAVRHLRPAERVMFSESVWSVRALVLGGVLVACVPLSLMLNGFTISGAFFVLGVALVLLAKARVQVDSKGVLLDLPLLGVRRRVPYREVRHAEAADRSPTRGWWPLVENTRWSGYVAGPGRVAALHLSDGRTFVVTAREAAVALINGELTRQRESKVGPGQC